MRYEIISAILGGGILGSIITWKGISYQNKRWIFTPSIEIRTRHILDAYNDCLIAFFNLNKAANVGEEEVTFKDNIGEPLDDYRIAINRIDIWVGEDSSGKLREILGRFRNFSNEIFMSKGKQPSLKSKDWEEFSKSLGEINEMVSYEIRSKDLRDFIFKLK